MIRIKVLRELLFASGLNNLNIDLEIKEGSFIGLMGKSGSGKTTLLRLIAGLDKPDSGLITVQDECWFNSLTGRYLKSWKRNVGFVFQDIRLFPHMTVLKNLLYTKNNMVLAQNWLHLAGLSGLESVFPSELSGGQKQRIALIQSIMRGPDILLLDEPFSGLDSSLKTQYRQFLAEVHQKTGVTLIMVSHDFADFFGIADRVLTLDTGRIINDGTVEELLLARRATSQKFSFYGTLLSLEPSDILTIATISAGDSIIEAVLTQDEARDLTVGDRVLVASKAFSPMVFKVY